MSRGVNKVILIGNVGQDPEQMYTGERSVTKLNLATSQQWTDANGNRKESTEWHRVVFFRKIADIVAEFVKKGSKIYVEGTLKTNKWQDKETGLDRYTTEIIAKEVQFLDAKGDKNPHHKDAALENYDSIPF